MKSKLLCAIILGVFNFSQLNAQWTRTHVTSSDPTAIEALCEHNGALYAAEFGRGLIK